jgi:signal transduction histidine kinase
VRRHQYFPFLNTLRTEYNQLIRPFVHVIKHIFRTEMSRPSASQPSQRMVQATIAGLAVAVFVLDSFFPLGFNVPVLYMIPIILTIRVHRPLAPFAMAAGATVLTLLGIWTSPITSLQPGLFNRSLAVLASWVAATLIWHTTQKHARRELEMLVAIRTAALEASQKQLRELTAQLLTAQEDERRRIARELHDDVNQRVASLTFEIDNQLQQMPDLPAEARDTLELVKNEVAELSDHLRDVAHQLHPSVLDDLGIASALRVFSQEFEQRERISVHLALQESATPLDRTLADCLFRITQEALRNVAKHAQATKVALALAYHEDHVLLEITDDGIGFVPQQRQNSPQGLGMVSMGERVRLAQGTIAFSSELGRGTHLSISLPFTGVPDDQATHSAR